MNKLILVAVAGLCFGNIYAKNPKKDKAEEGFVFTTVKENPITSIKNQNRSSKCMSLIHNSQTTRTQPRTNAV